MDNDQTHVPPITFQPWGLRVRDLRKAANLTQDELAGRVGTTKATISKIERSTNPPKLDWIEKLARAFDVDAAALTFSDKPVATRIQAVLVPVIGMISAGNWREAINNPEDLIPMLPSNKHVFVLRVDGDSLDKIAPDGSYVAIDPTDPTFAEGSVYAVQNADGETTLKRFRRGPDRLEPVSNNAVHRPIMLGADAITVIGRATQVIQNL